MQETEIAEAAKLRDIWRLHPEIFFRDVLGVELEPYQIKILLEIALHGRVAISACHDVGKSFTLARVVLWFGMCFPFCKIVTTAPTGRQVKAILWSEIRHAYAHAKMPLGGTMLTTEWQIDDNGSWFAMGFSPQKEAGSLSEGQGTQSSFQGFHAPFVLVIFDEATGIPKQIWNMAEGLLTSPNVKFVAIGNPTSRASEFYRCFLDRTWRKLKLSCFDAPNVRANGITSLQELEAEIDKVRQMGDAEALLHIQKYKIVRPWGLTLQWVVSKILKWGLNHPLTLGKILGEFPEEGENNFFALGAVELAQSRDYEPSDTDRKTIGVDVARFGSDTTVLTAMHGGKVLAKKTLVKLGTTQVTGEVLAFAREVFGGTIDVIVVDETGVGGGVVDELTEARNAGIMLPVTCEIRGVQFGAACENEEDKERYTNIKARMFDLLSQDMKTNIALLDEEVYVEELPTLIYAYDSKGKLVMESKDQYKKRTGLSSPDHSDSLALANYGRYDELSVGDFTPDYASTGKPLAWVRRGQKQW
jgi:phage terminase large subunit